MNKYQKIAILIGAVILILIFGKTIYGIGFRAVGSLMGFLWKGILVVVVVLAAISYLKKLGKNK